MSDYGPHIGNDGLTKEERAGFLASFNAGIGRRDSGHGWDSPCPTCISLRRGLEQASRGQSAERDDLISCSHEWTERDQGPGFRWSECWLCGETTDYR